MHAFDCNIFGSRALESYALSPYARQNIIVPVALLEFYHTGSGALLRSTQQGPIPISGTPSAIGDADKVFSDNHCAKNSSLYFFVLTHLRC